MSLEAKIASLGESFHTLEDLVTQFRWCLIEYGVLHPNEMPPVEDFYEPEEDVFPPVKVSEQFSILDKTIVREAFVGDTRWRIYSYPENGSMHQNYNKCILITRDNELWRIEL